MKNKCTLIKRAFGIVMVALFSATIVSTASAVQIDFTGGTVYLNDGTTATTNNSVSFQNVWKYEEDGFSLEFIFGVTTPDIFSSITGDYYSTGNDVIHGHWSGNDNQPTGPFGQVDEIRVSKIDGNTFDLGGFRVSTNTAIGGSISDGNELTWINSSKANQLFSVTPDSWGLGAGPDPLISIAASNIFFDDIDWFSFTNDASSSAVGLGLDNFFLDEPGDPAGQDPTNTVVPEPSTFLLLGGGLAGLAFYARRRRKE